MTLIENVNPNTPWLQVEEIKMDEGPDLDPSNGTRLDVHLRGDVLIVKETVVATGVINFIEGHPLGNVEKIEFTINP